MPELPLPDAAGDTHPSLAVLASVGELGQRDVAAPRTKNDVMIA